MDISDKIFSFISEYRDLGLFLMLFIEESGVPLPIPGDFIIFYAGFKVGRGELTFLGALIYSMLGVLLGSSILYCLFRFGGRPIVRKYGRYVGLTDEKIGKLDRWFLKYQKFVILVGRFFPGLRTVLSAAAGFFGLSYKLFFLQILLSSFVWIVVLLELGSTLGERWQPFAFESNRIGNLLFIVGLTVAGILIGRQIVKTIGQERNPKGTKKS